ncbi:chromosome (plasmid) partitioning protein parA [Vibrio sp. JCM 19236]|nr:chromosome (plasmid) partitioning protein parA [Vibrio sp. JCM 19236]
MARVICIGNGKGGVAKSTTVVNLAYELTKKGKKVLVLDFDAQADTTKFLTSLATQDQDYFIGDVLLDRKFDIRKAIYPAVIANDVIDNLFIIKGRAGDAMTKLVMDMNSVPKREERLKLHLQNIMDEFDFVIIDTAPNPNVLMMNAVMAASEFIIPTEFAEHSLDGIETILTHICEVAFVEEDEIDFMVLPTKIARGSTKSLRKGNAYCGERFPDNMAQTYIWHRTIFAEAESVHKPMSMYKSSDVAAMWYKNFAKEVIENVI